MFSGPDRSKISPRLLLLAPVAVAVLAIGLDVMQWLRAAPLWVDEEMIAINVRDRAFSELPGALWLGQGAPLGWLFGQRAAILAFGTSELTLRLFPLLFGAATIVTALWIGTRWLNRLSTVLLVTLVSIGQWMSHYRFEVKHYSADAFFALLIPALAAWVLTDESTDSRTYGPTDPRGLRWWIVAALAQWFAYGALLVTPACALLIAVVLLRRHGVRAAVEFCAAGLIWLLSLGAHYAISLQYTDNSRHLRTYWSGDVPPESMNVIGIAGWIAGRLDELASNPGGTALAVAMWIAVVAGFLVSRRRMLAAMFAAVPLSAFVLAALRLVPLSDRLALWIVPALYVGLALLFDAGIRDLADAWRRRAGLRVALGAVAASVALYVSGDVIATGQQNLDVGVPGDSNHALDDRRAVAWIAERRRPGDVIMTTRLGWPAVLWYGGISLRRNAPGGQLPDGTLMLELTHQPLASTCADELEELILGRRRVFVHVGFPDMPQGFYERVLYDLAPLGTVVESARFSVLSRTALIELHGVSEPDSPEVSSGEPPPLDGCVGALPVRRW